MTLDRINNMKKKESNSLIVRLSDGALAFCKTTTIVLFEPSVVEAGIRGITL